MERYMKLNNDLAKKQVIEKITLELVYEFLILDNKEMNIIKVDDVNIYSKDEYLSFVDEAIFKLNSKTKLDLTRDDKKIFLGNCNK